MIEIVFGITLAVSIYLIFDKILKIPHEFHTPLVFSTSTMSVTEREELGSIIGNMDCSSNIIVQSDNTTNLTFDGGTNTWQL